MRDFGSGLGNTLLGGVSSAYAAAAAVATAAVAATDATVDRIFSLID